MSRIGDLDLSLMDGNVCILTRERPRGLQHDIGNSVEEIEHAGLDLVGLVQRRTSQVFDLHVYCDNPIDRKSRLPTTTGIWFLSFVDSIVTAKRELRALYRINTIPVSIIFIPFKLSLSDSMLCVIMSKDACMRVCFYIYLFAYMHVYV